MEEKNTIHCEMCITCRYLNKSNGDCQNIEKLDYDEDNGICKHHDSSSDLDKLQNFLKGL